MPRIPTIRSNATVESSQGSRGMSIQGLELSSVPQVNLSNIGASGRAALGFKPLFQEPLVDRVERDAFNKAIDYTKAALDSSLKLADETAKINAVAAQQEVTQKIQSLLYDTETGLYSKSGREFLEAEPAVRQQIEKTYMSAAERLSPREQFHFADFYLADKRSTMTDVARHKLQEHEVALSSAKALVITDATSSFGLATSVEDLQDKIAASAPNLLSTLPNDANVRVKALKDLTNLAFKTKTSVLLRSGKTAAENFSNLQAAEAYMAQWDKAPLKDPVALAEMQHDLLSQHETYMRRADSEDTKALQQLHRAEQMRLANYQGALILSNSNNDPELRNKAEQGLTNLIATAVDPSTVVHAQTALEYSREGKYRPISTEDRNKFTNMALNPEMHGELADILPTLSWDVAGPLHSLVRSSTDHQVKRQLDVVKDRLIKYYSVGMYGSSDDVDSDEMNTYDTNRAKEAKLIKAKALEAMSEIGSKIAIAVQQPPGSYKVTEVVQAAAANWIKEHPRKVEVQFERAVKNPTTGKTRKISDLAQPDKFEVAFKALDSDPQRAKAVFETWKRSALANAADTAAVRDIETMVKLFGLKTKMLEEAKNPGIFDEL